MVRACEPRHHVRVSGVPVLLEISRGGRWHGTAAGWGQSPEVHVVGKLPNLAGAENRTFFFARFFRKDHGQRVSCLVLRAAL